jgi:YD repeat-containing protein
MQAHKRPTLVAALLGLAMLLLPAVPPFAEPLRLASASDLSPALEAIRAAVLAEPLVATGPTSTEEDKALARALASYERRSKKDDFSSLVNFLAAHPRSGWAPAVLTNLGLSYIHYGYFSKAIDSWQKAWRQGKGATEAQPRALVDRAVSELAMLYASLGKMAELSALFDELANRPITGSATELIQGARETLTNSEKDPQHLFLCGPLALRALMLARGAAAQEIFFLQWYHAGSQGTNLAELTTLADRAKLRYRLVFRQPGQAVPMPSVAHMKVGHFAAIVGEGNGRLRVEDAAFQSGALWMTPEALDAEASGYFLVPADVPQRPGWRAVAQSEAANIWGKGNTSLTRPGDYNDRAANGSSPKCPMCAYDIKESSVGLTLFDQPVGYVPPIGPSAKVTITYNQREDSQPANFNYINISQKWTLNWISFVIDDPTNAGATVSRYLPGGGSYVYSGYSSGTGQFAAQDGDGSILSLIATTPVKYQRNLNDGSIEIYSLSDGATAYPRHVFLTQIVDPQGNALTLSYDSRRRITSATDAVGRQTTFTYGLSTQPLLLTQITDPFGRSANLAYDSSARLVSITDILGLTSSFTYDANSLVNSMTTPYGTTSFTYTAPGTSAPPRFVQVTDPMGFNEREEWLEPSTAIPMTDPAATIPAGMPLTLTNNYLQYRNSFHWDKNAYVVAGCTPTGGCDYTKARITHFTHVAGAATTPTWLRVRRVPCSSPKNRVRFPAARFHTSTISSDGSLRAR